MAKSISSINECFNGFLIQFRSYSSITLPPTLKVTSDAIVETETTNISLVIDKTLYFKLLLFHHSKALKEELLLSGI